MASSFARQTLTALELSLVMSRSHFLTGQSFLRTCWARFVLLSVAVTN